MSMSRLDFIGNRGRRGKGMRGSKGSTKKGEYLVGQLHKGSHTIRTVDRHTIYEKWDGGVSDFNHSSCQYKQNRQTHG